MRKRRWNRGMIIGFAVVILIGYAIICHRIEGAFSFRTHCVGNLYQIYSSKSLLQTDRSVPAGTLVRPSDIEPYLGVSFSRLQCPDGGNYSLGAIGAEPTCSHTNVVRFGGRDWFHSLEF
jgi:hypothetical protein